jgi:hypothetical protein
LRALDFFINIKGKYSIDIIIVLRSIIAGMVAISLRPG